MQNHDKLYEAVQEYVKSKGGSVLVIGGIQVIRWPTDKKFNYTISIKCTGVPPRLDTESEVSKSMQDMTLLKITVVTEDSTGTWSAGELEYGAMIGPLRQYLNDSPENRVKLADWLQMLSEKCRNDEAPFQV